MSIAVLSSVLFIGGVLKDEFWKFKIEDLSRETHSIQTLNYGDTIHSLDSFHTRHSKAVISATGIVFKGTSPITALTTLTTTITSEETIICKDCKKKCPKTEMKRFPGQFHKTCQECGLKASKERRNKTPDHEDVPSASAIKKAEEFLARAKQPTSGKSNLTTSIGLTTEDVERMIADSRLPTFGSFGPGNYVTTTTPTLRFLFDNCASLSSTFGDPKTDHVHRSILEALEENQLLPLVGAFFHNSL